MWKSNLRIANDNDNIQAGTEVELATACWALHCTSIPIRIERDYRLEISITPVLTEGLTAQHRTRDNVCKISIRLFLLFVHIYGKKKNTNRYLSCCVSRSIVHLDFKYLYKLIISSYSIYHLKSNATFLVSSIAVGPKCSYNFVPPMNSSISNQTFNEIHKRQVLITNLQYSKDFNLILNRFNLIRFSVSLSMLSLETWTWVGTLRCRHSQ